MAEAERGHLHLGLPHLAAPLRRLDLALLVLAIFSRQGYEGFD